MSARVIVEIRTGGDVLRFERSDEPEHRISWADRKHPGCDLRPAHLGVKRDFVEDVIDELDTNPPPLPTVTPPAPETPKEPPMLKVEIEWAEPPAPIQRGRGRAEQNDAIVAELKKRPGEWAAVQRGLVSSGCTTWTKRGCEAVARRGNDSPEGGARFDIYARWPA